MTTKKTDNDKNRFLRYRMNKAGAKLWPGDEAPGHFPNLRIEEAG
jgi:hypothetical protein